MVDLAEFWDEAHGNPQLKSVVDYDPQIEIDYLDQAGPFSLELAFAEAVLDVGPGCARVLRGLPRDVLRYALEVSPAARLWLGSFGINCDPPESRVDLAWSLSCFQHCPPAEVQRLLHRVSRSLRPGAEAYLQDVEDRPGAPPEPLTDDQRLRAGRWTTPVDTFLGWLTDAGLTPLAIACPGPPHPECPVQGYVVRCQRG